VWRHGATGVRGHSGGGRGEEGGRVSWSAEVHGERLWWSEVARYGAEHDEHNRAFPAEGSNFVPELTIEQGSGAHDQTAALHSRSDVCSA
jgi:hypothetical protein